MGLFDPEGLGATAGRNKSGSSWISPGRQIFSREKRRAFLLYVYKTKKNQCL
ncbi:hypothetical protein ACQCVP_19860 [Rossellomorea vietnamensis]